MMDVYKKRGVDTIHLRKGCQGAEKEIHVCMKCAGPLVKQARIHRISQDHNQKEFVRYKDRKKGKKEPPHVVVFSGKSLKFSHRAIELSDEKVNYLKPFLSKDGTMVALKPVLGGDVDADCLSYKGNTLSFVGIANRLAVEFGSAKYRFEVEWDDGDKMYIIDFSKKMPEPEYGYSRRL